MLTSPKNKKMGLDQGFLVSPSQGSESHYLTLKAKTQWLV